MKMVITLRNGVQIKMNVEAFSVGRSPIGAELRTLTWTLSDASTELSWVDLREVVAVHAEREAADDA
jgi:hypothetical protein